MFKAKAYKLGRCAVRYNDL